jgi:hypothetical protein
MWYTLGTHFVKANAIYFHFGGRRPRRGSNPGHNPKSADIWYKHPSLPTGFVPCSEWSPHPPLSIVQLGRKREE